MSGSHGGDSAEPNLTPILDMVFQLITFFMLVMNFKAAELDLNLKLPALLSARPLTPTEKKEKFLVLNVEIATPCPHANCDALATLIRIVDEDTKKVKGYKLHCERGHEEASSGAITNGKTCLSVYHRLLAKKPRGKDVPSIETYLKDESEVSLLAAHLTRDEIVKEAKELPDTVVVRADESCRFGAVNYIVTSCQALGYRKFALKTMHRGSE